MDKRIKPYGRRKTLYSRYVYLMAAILWLIFVICLNLVPPNWIGILLILLPLFIFGVAFYYSSDLTIEVEDEMFKINHLSLGLVIVLSLFTWISKDYQGEKGTFVSLLIIAIILSLLAVIDVWIKKKWLSLVKQIKSCFQILSIFLLIYALYLFLWHNVYLKSVIPMPKDDE